MIITNEVFLLLLRAGLWAHPLDSKSISYLLNNEKIEWDVLYRLAEEQSVLGLFVAGIESFQQKGLNLYANGLSQEVLLQMIGELQMLEQQNLKMNVFIAALIEQLRKNDVYAILIKGQGIAQCYEKPLWRSCGDVDLLLSDSNYNRALDYLRKLATKIEDEYKYYQHLAMTIDGWLVELHGTMRGGVWKGIDRELDRVQNTIFYNGSVRSWMNGRTQVLMPGVNEDVVYVFTHGLQHFFKEGIGLRQICDWCRLLWTYREKIDVKLLERRLRKAGIMSEWKAFGSLAVEYLGMPVEAMPFYSSDAKWKTKAGKVLLFVLETGNFGHNRDYSFYKKYPYLVYKAISLWKHIKDFGRYFVIFPLDAIKVTWRRMCVGVSVAIRGGKHE